MEAILVKFAEWAASSYPLVSLLLMALGTLFVMIEIIVKLTPSKADDEVWSRITNGYTGAILRVFMRFSKVSEKK
jgi:hypothetical protein